MKPIKSLFPLIAVAFAAIAQSNPVDAPGLQNAVESCLVSEDGSNRMNPFRHQIR